MKKTLIILISLQLLLGCKSSKNVIDKGQIAEKNNAFSIVGPNEIKIGTIAYFEVINNTLSPITLYSPWQQRIEKFENNAWRRVKIISCPCGADCNAPPKTLVLNPNEKHKLDWNLKEGYCAKPEPNGIPATIESYSEVGLYRISIDYGTDEKRQVLTKEFQIVK